MLDAIFYLIPGIFVFFVFPSLVFMFVEGWNYTGSLYFSFVSLSTIGLGDYVPGKINMFGLVLKEPIW